MNNIGKKIFAILAMLTVVITLSGCASCSRALVDIKSNANGGLERTITVYTATGEVIAEYEGMIDVENNQGGCVKFDMNGKRYIYYNCFVETIANIE